MAITIQNILDKFTKKYEAFELCEIICKKDHDDLKQFLQDNLTLMLEEIEKEAKELHKLSEIKSAEHECQQEGYEYGLEDVINIINSHKV